MKIELFFFIIVLALSVASTTFGTLLTISDDIIYDDASNQYWQKDLGKIAEKFTGSASGAMHWADVPAATNILNTSFASQDWKDWHLASRADISNLLLNSLPDITTAFAPNYVWTDSPFVHDFVLFGMVDSGFPDNKDALFIYWSHRDDGSSVSDTYNSFWNDEHNTSFGASGWFVADAAPVPEPTTKLLFVLGLVFYFLVKDKGCNFFL